MKLIKKFSIIVVALFLCYLILTTAINFPDESGHRATATSRVAVSPTATAALNDAISWASYHARKHMPKDMTLDTVETIVSVGETYLTIACNMSQMWDGDDYIRSAAEFIIGVIPGIRDKQGFDHVTFLFYGPFTDKYGNSNQSLGMRAMYDVEDLQAINCEHFDDRLYINPDAIFKVNNNYLIHPSYYD